jgi:photosystem II stability/assembly factor-like uncharacterized protein
MKTKYMLSLVLVVFLLSFISAYSQWERVSLPFPFENEEYVWLDVFFLESNPYMGWVCGKRGAILRTTDGGETWQGTQLQENYQLESINFVSETVGFTSGQYRPSEGRIFKTTDGGANWFDITPDEAWGLWGNYFVNENVGIVIGNGCTTEMQFFRTEDGGNTWELSTTDELGSGLCDVVLYSENGEGYASSSGLIWRTINGGRSWFIFSVSGERDWQEELSIYNESFLVPYSPFCTGGNPGGVRMTTDNGATWKEFYTGQAMFGTFLHDELRGWGAGWDETVVYTSDGGDTWITRNCGIMDNDDLDDMFFLNDSTGWLVGGNVYRYAPIINLDPVILANGSLEFCEGDSVVLFTNTDYNHYKWSDKSTDRSITVKESGTYWVRVNNSECDSAISKPVDVIVHPKPNAILTTQGPIVLCEGDTLVMELTEQFDSYEWSNGKTSSNLIVTETGNYSVVVYNEYGCADTAYFDVKVEPKPDPEIQIIGNINGCIGDTVIMLGTPGYSVYEWYRENEDQPFTTGKQQIEVTETGFYYLYVESEAGCSGVSKLYEVTMQPDSNRIEIMSIDDSKIFDFDSTRFLELKCLPIVIRNIGPDPVTLLDAYLFIKQPFSIPESQFPISIAPYDTANIVVCYTPSKLGVERDTLQFEDRCDSQFIPLVATGASNNYQGPSNCDVDVDMVSVSINKNYIFSTSLPAPNPSDGTVEVPFNKVSSEDYGEETAYMTNLFGEKVCQGKFSIGNSINIFDRTHQSGTISFECADIPSGTYLIIIDSRDEIISYSVIVSK